MVLKAQTLEIITPYPPPFVRACLRRWHDRHRLRRFAGSSRNGSARPLNSRTWSTSCTGTTRSRSRQSSHSGWRRAYHSRSRRHSPSYPRACDDGRRSMCWCSAWPARRWMRGDFGIVIVGLSSVCVGLCRPGSGRTHATAATPSPPWCIDSPIVAHPTRHGSLGTLPRSPRASGRVVEAVPSSRPSPGT